MVALCKVGIFSLEAIITISLEMFERICGDLDPALWCLALASWCSPSVYTFRDRSEFLGLSLIIQFIILPGELLVF